jgi:hypothetical protein
MPQQEGLVIKAIPSILRNGEDGMVAAFKKK